MGAMGWLVVVMTLLAIKTCGWFVGAAVLVSCRLLAVIRALPLEHTKANPLAVSHLC